MAAEVVVLVAASLLAVPLSWLLPRAVAPDGVAVFGLASLAAVAPWAALWLALSSAGTVLALALMVRTGRRGPIATLWSAVLLAALLGSRERPDWQLLGGAYLTLRNLHVLLDGWMGQGERPGLRAMLRYQAFLPVLVAGPIHRLPPFARALTLRRFDRAEVAAGAERALLGLAQTTILGAALMGRTSVVLGEPGSGFLRDWALSAAGWIQLYFVFAGLSSFAIGVARMMGIAIEENFRAPFASRNLLEFWTRWHMSLSFWVRDYVFQPVAAATRRPVIGLAAAMLAIGLWHETSLYYVLWSAWQVAGIVGNRLLSAWAGRRGVGVPDRLGAILGPLAVLGWLSLAKPVISVALGVAA